jgi:hypothetical protein
MSMVLTEIVPWGRSRREYELMFRLEGDDLRGHVLGCGDGPASFNAEVTTEGGSVISVDPIYQFRGDQVARAFDSTTQNVMTQIKATPDDWVWSFHRSPDDLLSTRRRVLERFLADYPGGRRAGRYLPGALPCLPLADQSFSLALCSHLLFLYSDLLDERFHIAAVLELCRVAREVRIFPLLTLDLRMSPHVPGVCTALGARGIACSVERVEYELQKGGNQMLRLWSTRGDGRS